jgi:putative PIN family toxin of toxin-antitoxin system
MIAVLDTNVIISAVLSPRGTPSHILQLAEEKAFTLVISEVLLAEYQEVLLSAKMVDRYRVARDEVIDLLNSLVQLANIVQPQENLSIIESDPGDNMVLECAVTGGAEYIVSGDKHLLGLGQYEGIRILSPADFLRVLEQEPA